MVEGKLLEEATKGLRKIWRVERGLKRKGKKGLGRRWKRVEKKWQGGAEEKMEGN